MRVSAIRSASCLVCVLFLFARPASAQVDHQTLTDALSRALFGTTDFFGGTLVENALTSQLTTFPIGSSSGAFTYLYDPQTRTFTRRNRSFGPWFAERASTLGRTGAFTVGSGTQFARYGSLDGRPLDAGVFHSFFKFPGGSWVGNQVSMSLSQQTTTVFASYALSPVVDVGVTVPFVRTTFQARVQSPEGVTVSSIVLGPGDIGPVSATGVGDIQVRAKWNAVRSARVDGSAQFELRLPTGDFFNLTGAGASREKLAALVSVRTGPLQEHFNVGYTFRLSGESPADAAENALVSGVGATANELDYLAGTEWAARARVTLTGEVIGRYLRGAAVFRAQTGDAGDYLYDVIRAEPANVQQAAAAVGGKFNVSGNTLVSAYLLFSVTSQGLTIRPTPVIGVEHAF